MKYLLSLFLFVAPILGFSQTLTIEQTIALALENNYSIKIAKSVTDQKEASWGNAGALPSLTLNGTYSKTEPEDATSRLNVDLGWTIFDGLKMFATHDKYKSIDEIDAIAFRATVEQTIREVINQYYLIVSTQQQLISIAQTLVVSQTRYEYVLAKYEIGSASKLDVLNAKVDFNTDSSSYLHCVEQILSAKTSLNQLLARAVDTEFDVVAGEIPYANNLDYADLHAKALEQNTELNVARLETVISEASKKEATALLMPTISLNAGYDFYNQNMIDRGVYYGACAKMNLFNGLETHRQRRNAQLALESAQYAEKATTLNVETQLRLNYINYQTNRDLVSIETENIDVAKQNMDISLERYQLGNLSSLELRESQRNYLNAINRYTNSLYLTKLSETILLQLAGELGKL